MTSTDTEPLEELQGMAPAELAELDVIDLAAIDAAQG